MRPSHMGGPATCRLSCRPGSTPGLRYRRPLPNPAELAVSGGLADDNDNNDNNNNNSRSFHGDNPCSMKEKRIGEGNSDYELGAGGGHSAVTHEPRD
eukprot:scaffold626723_cov29-Prasinocladus_malaysianus.AAC.1